MVRAYFRQRGDQVVKRSGLYGVLMNFLHIFGSHVVSTGFRIVYIIVIARFLAPSEYGLINYGMAWYLSFICLTYLGLDVVLGREIGRGRVAGESHPDAAGLAGTTLAIRGIAAVCVAIFSVVSAFIVEPSVEARTLIMVFSVALVGRAVWLWCTSVFTAFEKTRAVLVLDLVFRPVEVLVSLAFLMWWMPGNIIALAVVHASLWCLQAAIGWALIVRRVTGLVMWGSFRRAIGLMRSGIPGAIYTLGIIWFLQAPTVLFRLVDGLGAELGQFSLTMQIVGYLQVIPYLLGSAALPALSRAIARDGQQGRAAAGLMIGGLTGVSVAVAGAGGWVIEPLIDLVFGSAYRPAGTLLIEAIWLLVPISLAIGVHQAVLSKSGGVLVVSVAVFAGIAVMGASFVPLTRAYSGEGALLSTGLGLSVWALGGCIAVFRSGILRRSTAP